MAHIPNPRKQFQFQVFINGMNPFLAQTVKLPDDESDIVEHGDAGFMVKTAGMKKLGQLTIGKISPAEITDNQFRDWRLQIMSTRRGGGDLPSLYKKSCIVEELSNDGISVIARHIYSGVWPQKLNGIDLSRTSSDNTITTVEFCVDEDE